MVPWLREADPEPTVEIHPDTANSMGIKNGDTVCVENWLGKCKRKARLTPVVHPKMFMVSHGWWFPEEDGKEPSLFGMWDVNVNQLIPMGQVGKSGLGAPVKSMLCRISKIVEINR